MRTLFLIPVILGTLLRLPLAAEDGASCAVLDAIQAKENSDARTWEPACEIRCSGCGCKGGPGYRILAGRLMDVCASYKNLIRECGPPPHERCKRECTRVVAGCSKPSANAIEQARRKGPRCQSGYRGADGLCVPAKRLHQKCGSPPVAPCVPDEAGVPGQ